VRYCLFGTRGGSANKNVPAIGQEAVGRLVLRGGAMVVVIFIGSVQKIMEAACGKSCAAALFSISCVVGRMRQSYDS